MNRGFICIFIPVSKSSHGRCQRQKPIMFACLNFGGRCPLQYCLPTTSSGMSATKGDVPVLGMLFPFLAIHSHNRQRLQLSARARVSRFAAKKWFEFLFLFEFGLHIERPQSKMDLVGVNCKCSKTQNGNYWQEHMEPACPEQDYIGIDYD